MTLWNIIFDFYSTYIFVSNNSIGYITDLDEGIPGATLEDMLINIGYIPNSYGAGDHYYFTTLNYWLSTTATLITIVGICILLWCFVRWLFRLTSNLITLRG